MEFLGVGPLELLFIILIALIVLGPKDMVKAGKTVGRWMRLLVTSSTWKAVQETSRNLRNLPNKLMRDAGIDEIQKEFKAGLEGVNKTSKDLNDGLKQDLESMRTEVDLSAWTNTPPATPTPPEKSTEQPAPQTDLVETTGETGNNTEDSSAHA